jgi:hypothetical protein
VVAVLGWQFARHAGLPLRALVWPGPQLGADLRSLLAGLASLRQRG